MELHIRMHTEAEAIDTIFERARLVNGGINNGDAASSVSTRGRQDLEPPSSLETKSSRKSLRSLKDENGDAGGLEDNPQRNLNSNHDENTNGDAALAFPPDEDEDKNPPPSQLDIYRYTKLFNRKEEYKSRAIQLSSDVDALKEENVELRRLLDWHKTHKTQSSELEVQARALEQENIVLHSHILAVQEFLRKFKVKDLDLHRAEREWMRDKEALIKTQEQLSKLQTEILESVERFDPNFDIHVLQSYVKVNDAIGKLIRSKEFRKTVLQGNPLKEWDSQVLWEDSFNVGVMKDAPSEMEKKMLLRQAIWKFTSERLLDRAYPMTSFDGAVGELASRLCFDKLFPDHETNENAGKWRSTTVRQLVGLEGKDGERDKENLVKKLSHEFSVYIQDMMLSKKVQPEQFESVMAKADVVKKLDEVFRRALGFSRLIMQERAAFTVVAPRLSQMKFVRKEDHENTTAQGVVVGVNDGHDAETDFGGTITLVGSPMVVKHGDGGGQNLDQSMTLVRAFVLIDP
ncbi:hypothetical protein TWF694_001383 [Orbilia ellipsospora]|uniref:Uncharacterized protein n=1 Tax=Orbilia ellipsospora TaxID=2528407 RepID=A0AAV9XRF9_9PEZI